MKKFLAITASAVLAFSTLAFAACGEKKEESVANLTYTEVDLSSAEKKSAFVNEVANNVNFDTMFGDTTAENYFFGLAADMKYNIDLSAGVKDFPVSETETKDLSASAKFDFDGSAKVKVSADGSLLGESKTAVKLNATLPEELFAMSEMPEDVEAMVKALIDNFDYSLTEYIDNNYLYAQLPQAFMDMLPEEAESTFPESGKIKIPLQFDGIDNPPIITGDEDLALFPFAAPVPDFSLDIQTSLIIGQVIELLDHYNVKIAVSTENGYALRLTADKDSVMSILGDVTNDPQTVAMINQLATFNTCALTAYLAVDKDGMFKEVSLRVDLDATVKIAANLIEVGSPEINGALKVNVDLSFKSFNGNITLPSDLDSYVDISNMM